MKHASISMRGAFGAALCLALAALSAAQTPPGYHREYLTDWTYFNRVGAINNHSQIVFSTRFVWDDPNTSEIMLYDNGVIYQLTLDTYRDEFPDINDDGTIVWSRGVGPGGTLEVAMYKNDQITLITNDAFQDYAPKINNLGHMVWNKRLPQGCANADSDIYFYDGMTQQKLSQDGFNNQGARLNDLDQVIWTRYNDCDNPWTAEIMRYADGQVTQLTQNLIEPQVPDINNVGICTWQWRPSADRFEILRWENGVTSVAINSCANAAINLRGDIACNRWHEENQTWQMWSLVNGTLRQMTFDAFWNVDGRINDLGEIGWSAGTPFQVAAAYNRRYPLGDLNCDGAVNILDVNPFVLALEDAVAYSEAHYCDPLLADTNGDGNVNILDINPFVDIVAAGRMTSTVQCASATSSPHEPSLQRPNWAPFRPSGAAFSPDQEYKP
ncbi:hypothetical protein RAS1_01240 [Phycisphaerae bacterium RAS1]|nr:hypothetical protein RAS1_01240 [Phycisphaerae bacterium RAS1]